jgi:predicted nucleic acid binding AN1-type Zn finger protein
MPQFQFNCCDIKSQNTTSISVDTQQPIRVYDIKVALSSTIQNAHISTLFLYTSIDAEKHLDASSVWNMQHTIVYYNILKHTNKCAICYKRAAPIIGDCSFCQSKFCAMHRLPESHTCVCINQCKQQQYESNRDTLMRNKCVASQI